MQTANKYKLEVTTPSDLEFVLTRKFDAPRNLVFEAMSKPEHVAKWWGPRGSTLLSCEMDFRPGGNWRYVMSCGDMPHVEFWGVYQEIIVPEKIASIEYFNAPIGLVDWFSSLLLKEQNAVTTLQTTVRHKTKENRDGHMNSGMEVGAGQTFERLEEYLQTL
jgi:uncharacterized protein YndB with AHSA1/START domain